MLQSSQQTSESKKRKASGPPGMGPPPKRKPTALESKLIELRKILNNLPPVLRRYDPGYFMEGMKRLQTKFDKLAVNEIQDYIADGGLDKDLFALQEQENDLEKALRTPTISSRPLERTQMAYSLMLTYLKKIRDQLDALVKQALAKPPPNDCGHVRAVMEHLTSKEGVELETFKGKLGVKVDVVRRKLNSIVELLQDDKMVHDDIRPKNIMIKVDQTGKIVMGKDGPALYMVDFDWSGKVGKVRYPPFLDHEISWPAGPEAFQRIGKKYARTLLDVWWDSFIEPVHPS
ncbi:hypothetical protein CPB86DRAFT_878326 [Serendipita vermifera]|nr:hypothetical protein CPB86DRAFT_878326 [Serendipita vermifera]